MNTITTQISKKTFRQFTARVYDDNDYIEIKNIEEYIHHCLPNPNDEIYNPCMFDLFIIQTGYDK